jgi:hypothetical protein
VHGHGDGDAGLGGELALVGRPRGHDSAAAVDDRPVTGLDRGEDPREGSMGVAAAAATGSPGYATP